MSDDARIPRPALLLGLAGLIPFLWSAATHLSPALAGWAGQWLPPMFLGAYVGLTWGTVILSFMSGVLWGFATRAEGGQATVAYALYVMDEATVARFGSGRLLWSAPFVLYGIFRYLYLVHQKEEGGNPTQLLLTDQPLLAGVVLWIVTAALVLYWPA